MGTPLRLTLALWLLAAVSGCENKSSPTEPPSSGGPTITASSGAQAALAGTWRSRCFAAPAGSPVAAVQETFVINAAAIEISLAGFSGADCSGISVAEEFTVDYRLAAESRATLAGRSVVVTRIEGTVQASGDDFLQVLHIDDGGVHRLYHGLLDSGPSDAEGYPTVLFEEPLDRQ